MVLVVVVVVVIRVMLMNLLPGMLFRFLQQALQIQVGHR